MEGQPKDSFGEVLDHSVWPVVSFLLVKAAGQQFFSLCAAVDGGLIREEQPFFCTHFGGGRKQSRNSYLRHVHKHNPGVGVARTHKDFAVVIEYGSVFVSGQISIEKIGEVTVHNGIRVKIEDFVRQIEFVSEQAQETVRRIRSSGVRRVAELFSIQLAFRL